MVRDPRIIGCASVPSVTDCRLSREDFVAILIEHGIARDRARALFAAIHADDARVVLDALESIAPAQRTSDRFELRRDRF